MALQQPLSFSASFSGFPNSSLPSLTGNGTADHASKTGIQFGKLRLSPEALFVAGIVTLLALFAFLGAAAFLLHCRLRRKQHNEVEKDKERAREQYEQEKGSTPLGKGKVADKSTGKEKCQKQPVNLAVLTGEETIAEFESRVREEFSTEKVLEEIREERSPVSDRHVDTVSQVAISDGSLQRNDSKVNIFGGNGVTAPSGDNEGDNNPALGKNINLETI